MAGRNRCNSGVVAGALVVAPVGAKEQAEKLRGTQTEPTGREELALADVETVLRPMNPEQIEKVGFWVANDMAKRRLRGNGASQMNRIAVNGAA